MKLSRKQFLRIAATASVAGALSGCESITSRITHDMGERIPDTLAEVDSKEIDPIFHLLSRAGFGPSPGDLLRARKLGKHAWLAEQLDPAKIDDSLCEWRARRFETLQLDPGTCYEYKKPVLRDEMVRHSVLKAVYSKRQLFEAMVEFWNDHLNIYIEKGDCMYLKPADERLVVRAHALGNFKDMILASAKSPAMLVYLDGNENKKSSPGGIPNENYARELLELHTLGVHGGYTQQDVFEVGRCLTGWHLHTPWQRAVVYFDQANHDDGEKHVLGHTIPAGGGAQDLERVVKIACDHPSTAHHIATKLVERFVSPEPPRVLVDKVASTFSHTHGDIKSTISTLFNSNEFEMYRGAKLKRPFRFVVSCLRSTGADTFAHASVIEYLTRMGHAPFQYPTPDGYSDHAEHWVSTLLWRWNFALALTANKLDGAKVPMEDLVARLIPNKSNRGNAELFSYFVGRLPTDKEMAALADYARAASGGVQTSPAALMGLILAAPAFQRY